MDMLTNKLYCQNILIKCQELLCNYFGTLLILNGISKSLFYKLLFVCQWRTCILDLVVYMSSSRFMLKITVSKGAEHISKKLAVLAFWNEK